jgi:hypothetical protein
MNVLVIGAGRMGAAFVRRLHAAGHEVSVTDRTGEKSIALAGDYLGVRAVSPDRASSGKDLVILATGYGDAVAALHAVGDLDGKVVLDATNPLTDDSLGLTIGHDTSAAEEIGRAVRGARIVKAFNTLPARLLASGSGPGKGQGITMYAASDHEDAKGSVLALAQGLGFQAINAGGLKNARYLEPLAALNKYLACRAGHGTGIAPTWICAS